MKLREEIDFLDTYIKENGLEADPLKIEKKPSSTEAIISPDEEGSNNQALIEKQEEK